MRESDGEAGGLGVSVTLKGQTEKRVLNLIAARPAPQQVECAVGGHHTQQPAGAPGIVTPPPINMRIRR